MKNEKQLMIKNRPFTLVQLATGVYLACGPMDIHGATNSQTIRAQDEKSATEEAEKWAKSLINRLNP